LAALEASLSKQRILELLEEIRKEEAKYNASEDLKISANIEAGKWRGILRRKGKRKIYLLLLSSVLRRSIDVDRTPTRYPARIPWSREDHQEVSLIAHIVDLCN